MASRTRTRGGEANPSYQLLQQDDLTGGLDLRRTATLVQPERARMLKNCSLREPGALVVRPGYAVWSTTTLGTNAGGQGGMRIYLASTEFTLFAWGGAVYKPTDSGGLSTVPVSTGYSSVNQIHFTHDRNIVAAFDSITTPQKSTSGTAWTRLGIAASTKGSTLSTVSTGGNFSTSEFGFIYTYKDRGLAHESDGSAESTISLTSTGTKINIQVPNSSDTQVDAIVVYGKNKTAGEQVYRKVTSGGQSSAASSTFVLDSSIWSANDEVPTTHGPAPVLGFAVNWKNRWWGRDATLGNRLWFTELFQPQAWYALYYIDIPFERGDEIMALAAQGDTLIVFGATKPYLIIGQTSLDFEVRPSAGAQAGAFGPKAYALLEQGVLHVASEGVWLFDGATDKLLSFDLEPAWRDLIENTSSANLQKIDVVYDYLQKEIRIAVPRLYPRGARGEWVLDLNRTREGGDPAWADTDRTIGGYIPWNGDETVAGNRGIILSWSPTLGQLFRESYGTTANGSNMVAEFEGPHFATGLHRARFIDLHVEYEPHAGTFSAEVVTDDLGQGSITLQTGSAISVYGTAVYGTATYAGAGRKKAFTNLPLSAEGRTVWLKTAYTGQEAFRWFTYGIGMVPEPRPRLFGE